MPPKKKTSKGPPDDAKPGSSSSDEVIIIAWQLSDMLVNSFPDEKSWAVVNVHKLLEEGCSIPFITR